jgi:hypothetical protein
MFKYKGEKNMSELKLTVEIVAAVGSFLTGIVMLITMIRVVSRLKFKEEVIYGGEAKKRFEMINGKELKDEFKIDPYEYEGGKNKIIPRLEFEKCRYNSLLMEPKFKKCKKRVRFIDENRTVHTWYLK